MNLKESYNQIAYIDFIKEFIPGFTKDVRPVSSIDNAKTIKEARFLGHSEELDLHLFELKVKGSAEKKISQAKDGFRIMKDHASYRALVIYHSDEDKNWRLSLMQMTPDLSDKGKIITKISNPRRYSFYLGPDAKTKTPENFLIKKGNVKDFEDLLSRFSVEVVNKDFYYQVAKFFRQLVGGDIKANSKVEHFEKLLKLPSVDSKNQQKFQEFSVRLIGRIIFCWFLKQKKSNKNIPLLPENLLSKEAVKNHADYYHSILEKIFFEALNKEAVSRDKNLSQDFDLVPFLNGGLFDPHMDDFYESQPNYALKIPDKWFEDLFEILETYNFTIDENTTVDVELAVDPEMLGRIFENLLAEINPETGETARKSTGSFYTPRIIVDYMVDQSLTQYLLTKTEIEERKVRALVSIDESDDKEYPLSIEQKLKIVNALDQVKIIDPACGSGAFPIGILQKIVFILGRIDQSGQLWFTKKTENLDSLLREDFKKKFENENFDYIRKTGVIRDSIYGVDIQPIAVEVSKLRCFLTLIVDEDIDDDADNRGIKPLPNLEFKFVAADTLIDLPGSNTNGNSQTGLFEEKDDIDQLKILRDQYFVSNGYEKATIRAKFKDIQRGMFKKQISVLGQGQMTMALADWDPFSNKSSSWFDPEWMFGIKDGFDIVIANPPYSTYSRVTGTSNKNSKSDNSLKKELFDLYPNSAEYKLSTYALFINNGIDLLNKNGHLAFITPDSYLLGRYFSRIRKFILQTCRIRSILFFKEDFWKSGIIGCPTIILLSKESDQNKRDTNKVLVIGTRNVHDFNLGTQRSLLYDQSYCKLQAYNRFRLFFDQKEFELVNKIENGATTLGEIASVHVGIRPKIGYEKVQNDKKIGETWHKGLTKGNDVTKYSVPWKGRYINIDPKILWAGGFNKDIVDQDKLLIRKTGDSLIVAYDSNGLYHLDILHSLILLNKKCNLLFLMAILNSFAMDVYYKLTTLSSGRVMAQTNIETIENLPIKIVSPEQQEPIINAVYEILAITKSDDYKENSEKQAKVKEYEKQIDQMVYKLYDLTEEEIKIIEKYNGKIG